MKVNWKMFETKGERRVLDALKLALRGWSVPDIARETGIPESSLYDIKRNGPFSHRNRPKRVTA
jgi:Homeodomain-like domain